MLLLITGNNRSGTTLLQRLCDSHPQVGLTNEFGGLVALGQDTAVFRRYLWRLWWRAQNRPFFRGDRLWGKWCYDPITMNKQEGTWGCFLSKVTRVNMVQNAAFIARLLRQLEGGCVDVTAVTTAYRALFPGTQFVGDNHPDYIYELHKFINYANLTCIFVYRDPRDMTSDVLQRIRPRHWQNEQHIQRDLRKWWPQNLGTAEQVAARWVNTIHLMEKHRPHLHTVCYEELVQNPNTVAAKLAQWLQLDLDGFNTSFIRPGGGIGNYRHGLSPQELEAVLTIAGPTMQRLGYKCE
jgi:hypothetical protein